MLLLMYKGSKSKQTNRKKKHIPFFPYIKTVLGNMTTYTIKL